MSPSEFGTIFMLEMIDPNTSNQKSHSKMTIDLTGGGSKKLDEDSTENSGEELATVHVYERKSSLSLKWLFHFMNVCIIIFIIIFIVIIMTMRGK